MLELPEVLTLSKQANDVLSGKTITPVSYTHLRAHET